MKTLDLGGIAELLKAASSDLRLPIAVLIGTGLRRGECLALKWGDVDLDGARMTIRRTLELVNGQLKEKPPKTARSARSLVLPLFVVAALREQKALQGKERRSVAWATLPTGTTSSIEATGAANRGIPTRLVLAFTALRDARTFR